jgi:hypothetical protein
MSFANGASGNQFVSLNNGAHSTTNFLSPERSRPGNTRTAINRAGTAGSANQAGRISAAPLRPNYQHNSASRYSLLGNLHRRNRSLSYLSNDADSNDGE